MLVTSALKKTKLQVQKPQRTLTNVTHEMQDDLEVLELDAHIYCSMLQLDDLRDPNTNEYHKEPETPLTAMYTCVK